MAGSVGSDLDLALRIRALVEGQDAIVGLGTSFIDLNQRIESLIRGLKAITGSQEGAAKEFEYIASVADKYGRSLLDLSDNYIKLIASSKDTALEGAAVKEVFEAVSSSMAVLGADTITTHRAFNALNQMMSKGQIYSEELKGQLAEAIPGALGILSRSLNISTQDMIRLMESGSLTSDVLLPFARQLQKEFGNAAAESTTFSQAIDRLKNTWTLLMKQLGDTGAWKFLTNSIGALADSSTVLAGILGSALALAAAKAAGALATTAKATYDNIVASRLYGSAAEQAAKAELDRAVAAERAAESTARSVAVSAQAAANQVEQAALQVAANERVVNSLIARNATTDQVAIATARQTQAQASLTLANDRLVLSEQALLQARLAEAEAIAVGNAAGAAALRQAAETEAVASAALRRATLRVAAEEEIAVALRARAAAESAAAANGQASQATTERLVIAEEKLLAARESLTAATLRHSAAYDQLAIAQTQAATAGNAELAAAQRVTAARIVAVDTSLREVAAAQLRLSVAERNLAALIAEGGSTQQLATAQAELALARKEEALAAERAAIASGKLTAAKQAETEASINAAIAANNHAKTQTLLSKAWGVLTGPAGMIALMVAGFAAMALAFREQDDLTKTLAKSTEDYAESLKKMSATAIAEAERRLELQQREDRTLVASYQARIAGIQQAIESIQAEGDARKDAAQRIAEYNQQIIDDTLAMEKIQARIIDSDIKLADGRRALAAKSAELNASQQQLTASSEALSIKLEEERRIVADLQAQKANGLDVDVQLQAAYKNLASTEGQLVANRGKLKLVTDDLKATTTGYAKALYDTLSDSELVAISHQGQASAMDQLEEKVKKTVQSMLALDQQQRDLVAAGKLMKAQYDALEKTIGDMADIHLREANAIGDVVKQREASVAQGDAQAELATRGLAIAENELRVSQARLEATKQELEINPKKKTALEKEINDLNALIVSQQAEIDKRRENVKATVLEAEARRQAIETTSESFARQQQQLQQSSADLLALKGLYRDLQASGAGLDALSAVFERIAAKEQEVALIASSMGGIMTQAAKNVGQDWEEMTTGFDRKTRQMIDSLEQLALRGVLTGQQLRDSIANAINTANTKQELDSLGSALLNLFENGKIGAEELQLRYDEIRVKLEAIRTTADPTSQALAKLGIDVPKQLDSVAESARRTFDQLDRGQVTSLKLQEAFLVYAEAAVRAAEANGRQIDPALKAEAANLGLSQTLELLIEKYQRLSPEIESNIKYIERWKDGASDQVSAIEGIVKAKSSEIQSEIDVANAKGETDKARRLSRELMQQEADGAVLIAQAKVIEQNAEYALAVAKRNELELKVAKNEATQEELGLAALVAQKELAEAIAANAQVQSLQVLADKLREINALRAGTNGPDGVQQNTKATKDNTAAVDANAEALKKNSKEAEANAGAAKSLAGFVKQLRDEIAALSEQALAEFNRKMANIGQTISAAGFRDLADDVGLASSAITDLQQHVEDAQAAFRYNFNNALFATGLGQYMDALKAAQAEVIALYYQQRVGVEQLKESLDGMTKSGAVDMGTLKLAVEATNGAFSLLKDQDLDALRKSIDAANESLRKMKEEAQSAQDRIAELNAEIASEKGDTAAADRLKLELEQRQALAEIEANLEKARNEKNAELIQLYEEQKRKLQELYDLKERNLEQDIKTQQQEANAAKTANATSGGSSSTATTSPPKTGTTASGGGGINVTVNAPNAYYLDPKAANDLARSLKPALDDLNRRLA